MKATNPGENLSVKSVDPFTAAQEKNFNDGKIVLDEQGRAIYEDPTRALYDEINNWDFDNNQAKASPTGHFTQIVWKDTTFIGAGRAIYNSEKAYGRDTVLRHTIIIWVFQYSSSTHDTTGAWETYPSDLEGKTTSGTPGNTRISVNSYMRNVQPPQEDWLPSGERSTYFDPKVGGGGGIEIDRQDAIEYLNCLRSPHETFGDVSWSQDLFKLVQKEVEVMSKLWSGGMIYSSPDSEERTDYENRLNQAINKFRSDDTGFDVIDFEKYSCTSDASPSKAITVWKDLMKDGEIKEGVGRV